MRSHALHGPLQYLASRAFQRLVLVLARVPHGRSRVSFGQLPIARQTGCVREMHPCRGQHVGSVGKRIQDTPPGLPQRSIATTAYLSGYVQRRDQRALARDADYPKNVLQQSRGRRELAPADEDVGDVGPE